MESSRQQKLKLIITEQQQTLREQQQRIEWTEAEIARLEAELHRKRCLEQGSDYVHRAYDEETLKSHTDDSQDQVASCKNLSLIDLTTRIKPEVNSHTLTGRKEINSLTTTATSYQRRVSERLQMPAELGLPTSVLSHSLQPASTAIAKSPTGSDEVRGQVRQLLHEIESSRLYSRQISAEIDRVTFNIARNDCELRRKSKELALLSSTVDDVRTSSATNRHLQPSPPLRVPANIGDLQYATERRRKHEMTSGLSTDATVSADGCQNRVVDCRAMTSFSRRYCNDWLQLGTADDVSFCTSDAVAATDNSCRCCIDDSDTGIGSLLGDDEHPSHRLPYQHAGVEDCVTGCSRLVTLV